MRILHVVPSYFPAVRYGGPIVAVHGLCRALAARGHTVEVFTTSIDGPADSAVPHGVPVNIDGVTVRYFASHILRRLSFAPSLAPALRRELDAADLVHLHSVFLWPTWAAARLADRSHVPYVLSPRGMLVKKLIEHRHRLLKSAWIGLVERANLRKAAAIHVTSNVEAAELAKFGWPLPRIAMIPNGVDEIDGEVANRVSDDIKCLAKAQPLILFLGRLSRVKALDRLLHAFAQTRVGNLAIVGTDYDGLAPQLLQLAADLNIAERVHIIARTVVGADKQAVFAAAKVFVLASHSESFGNAVLEAMQHGVPVVVTRDVGAADVVQEAGCGIVVEGDAGDLRRAIEQLANNPEVARSMGEAGRRHVREHYGWGNVAARMEVFYRSLRI
jgi:glycosyltransferase involved in cell wall biosynthesis